MAASLLSFTLACSLLVGAYAQQKVLPVNRLFTVDAGEPTPDLKCVVGFHSIEEEVTWRMNCSEAHTKEMVLSKDLRKALKWVPGRRILKFGSQSNGKPWPGNVTSWVCATIPMSGTVTYDCIPENHAPTWWRSVLRGPALGLHMRKPGCNGGTCYCNQRDLCNEKAPYFNVMEDGSCPGCHQDEEEEKKENGGERKSGNRLFLLTAIVAALLLVI